MERTLLPKDSQDGRRVHILHGLGGIGKTQLAVAYARKHQRTYSAILWLNGSSKDTLLQSLAAYTRYANISRWLESTLSTVRHTQDIEAEAKAVLAWLTLNGNRRWLMIFDNVDRDYSAESEDSQAYDIESFLPAADHGFILVTTRLPHLGDLGNATKVSTVDSEQALQILVKISSGQQNTLGNPVFRYQFSSQLSWLTDDQK